MSSLSFHYLAMAVHFMIQKNFMEQVKPSGLTSVSLSSGLSSGSQRRQPEKLPLPAISNLAHSPLFSIAWKKMDSLNDGCWMATEELFIFL